jgi:hypothetical protein
MKDHNHVSHQHELIGKLKARQSNTLWPDTLRATRDVGEFLWHGDTKATPVQRAALVIFALMYLVPALGFAIFMFKEKSWVLRAEFTPLGLIFLVVGIRLSRNVFRHPARGDKQ